MQAMNYEILLRRVYESARSTKNGANADIYRPMERYHRNLTTKSLYATQDERIYEYHKAFVVVRENVRQAINTGTKKIQNLLNNDEVKQIQQMLKNLTIDFYDKDALDKIIVDADKMFQEHGLNLR